LYNRCTGIYKFGNNTYPRRIRRRSNLGHIFQEKIVSYGLGNTVFDLTFSLSVFNEYVPYRILYKACHFSSCPGEPSPALQYFSHIHH